MNITQINSPLAHVMSRLIKSHAEFCIPSMSPRRALKVDSRKMGPPSHPLGGGWLSGWMGGWVAVWSGCLGPKTLGMNVVDEVYFPNVRCELEQTLSRFLHRSNKTQTFSFFNLFQNNKGSLAPVGSNQHGPPQSCPGNMPWVPGGAHLLGDGLDDCSSP